MEVRRLRRGLMLLLFAAGCFGLGLVAARLLGWMPSSEGGAPSSISVSGTAPEPRIYIDAGVIELYDGSLTINPPPPPQVDP